MDFTETLKEFLILSALTLGTTQVYKEIINDINTQKASVCIATILAMVTGTSLLSILGFVPSKSFVQQLPFLCTVYAILFYIVDLLITGFIASKGSNYIVDLLKGNLNNIASKQYYERESR